METVGPGGLSYRIRTPRAGTGPAPALVLLHGRGADENDLFSFSSLVDDRFVVVSPRAPLPLGGGYMWYRMMAAGEPLPDDLSGGLAALEALLDNLGARHGVDLARVYVLGFSQGALMTGGLLLTTPERLAGALLLSGYLPLGGTPSAPARDRLAGKPVFVAHGTQDAVIPVGAGRATRLALEALGAEVTYREYPAGHGITAEGLEDIRDWVSART